MADPAKIIEDLRQAADGLKSAAADLRKSSGGKSIGQSLIESAKNFLDPAKANAIAGRMTVQDLYGFDPKQDRETLRSAKPIFQKSDGDAGESLKQAQHEMIRSLVKSNQDKGNQSDDSGSDKPYGRIHSAALRFGNAIGEKFGNTKLGRMIPKKVKMDINAAFGRTVARIAGRKFTGKGVSKVPPLFGKGSSTGGIGGGTKPAAGGVGGALGAVAGFAAVVLIAAAALVTLYKSIVAAADKQREAMFKYAEVSASIALIKGEAEYKDTLRDMQRGERLAPSARSLSNADQRLKDNSSDLIVLVESIKNMFLTVMENGLVELIGPLNRMAKGVVKWLEDNKIIDKDSENDFQALDQFLDMVKREADAAKVRGDQWHHAARADRR